MPEVPEPEGFADRKAHFEVEPFHHPAVVEFFGLEIIHEQFLVFAQGFDELFQRFMNPVKSSLLWPASRDSFPASMNPVKG
jgi:hypothetical protein